MSNPVFAWIVIGVGVLLVVIAVFADGAFLQGHRQCRDLAGAVDGKRV